MKRREAPLSPTFNKGQKKPVGELRGQFAESFKKKIKPKRVKNTLHFSAVEAGFNL